MIAPHVLAISLILSLAWGTHLIDAVHDYIAVRAPTNRRRSEVIKEFRQVIAATCLFSFGVAYVFRTAIVLAGFGDVVAGQIVFFALIGVNVPGAAFLIISRKFD